MDHLQTSLLRELLRVDVISFCGIRRGVFDSLRMTMLGKMIRSTKFSSVLCASNNDLWLPIFTTTAKKPKDLLTSYTNHYQ